MRRARSTLDAITQKELKRALPVAVRAALDAGRYIRHKFGRYRSLRHKADTSLVTEVDRRSEAMVIRALKKGFPRHHIVAEETGVSGSREHSPFRWHIDPLDGTTNFVHAFPIFCVSIGLEYEQGVPVLGVVYNPMTEELYTAIEGHGAFRNKKRLRVSTTRRLADGLLSTGFSTSVHAGRASLSSKGPSPQLAREMAVFSNITAASHGVRRTGSAALDLTFVATGQLDGFWERGLKTWDVAAASLLVLEAGGSVTRLDNQPFRLGDSFIVATNGRIHDDLLRLLNRA